MCRLRRRPRSSVVCGPDRGATRAACLLPRRGAYVRSDISASGPMRNCRASKQSPALGTTFTAPQGFTRSRKGAIVDAVLDSAGQPTRQIDSNALKSSAGGASTSTNHDSRAAGTRFVSARVRTIEGPSHTRDRTRHRPPSRGVARRTPRAGTGPQGSPSRLDARRIESGPCRSRAAGPTPRLGCIADPESGTIASPCCLAHRFAPWRSPKGQRGRRASPQGSCPPFDPPRRPRYCPARTRLRRVARPILAGHTAPIEVSATPPTPPGRVP